MAPTTRAPRVSNGLITPELAAFVGAQTSFFLATASRGGQPYVQHRGGPAGFLRVIDQHTLAFADLRGNRQYLSIGNLAENDKVHLFLIDYAHKQRIKIWGTARVVDDDPALLAALTSDRAERAIVITVGSWDVNCPAHIPQRFDAVDVERALAEKDARIAELEARVRALTSTAAAPRGPSRGTT
jgi:hypothetical protein